MVKLVLTSCSRSVSVLRLECVLSHGARPGHALSFELGPLPLDRLLGTHNPEPRSKHGTVLVLVVINPHRGSLLTACDRGRKTKVAPKSGIGPRWRVVDSMKRKDDGAGLT